MPVSNRRYGGGHRHYVVTINVDYIANKWIASVVNPSGVPGSVNLDRDEAIRNAKVGALATLTHLLKNRQLNFDTVIFSVKEVLT